MNIILILLLIHSLCYLIFKPKNNTLNCGIFAWAGKDPKKFNKDKFDKLGLYNIERGKSSCGISYDGEVYIGIGSTKLYSDFIIDQEIKPTQFPIVIGHTRQASSGNAVTVDNAHPFAFTNKTNEYEFIGCHNGTLYNTKELAEKYEIDEKVEKLEIIHNSPVNTIRTKIDSEILLEAIFKNKNFHILNDYIGAAALAFTDLSNPNVLYLFKGASKEYTHSKPEDVTEERPLYVYLENKNSMYVSSIENSLRTIGGNDKNIININCNTLYKITDGDFINAETIHISRANAQQREKYSTKNYNMYGEFASEYYDNYDFGKKSNEVVRNLLPPKKDIILTGQFPRKEEKEVKENKDEVNNIYTEKLLIPIEDYGSRVYFNKLRYWRNGHLINGIFCWIQNYGYKFLGHTKKEAEDLFWYNTDKHFQNGLFYETHGIKEPFIPFKSENVINPPLFYFVEGVQIRTFIDYSITNGNYKELEKGSYLPHVQLSNIASHPIINLNFNYKEKDFQTVMLDGKIYSGTYAPLGSEKIYTFEKGNLITTRMSDYFVKLKNELFDKNEKNKTIEKDVIELPNLIKKDDSSEKEPNLKLTSGFPQIEIEEFKMQEQNSDDELLEDLIEKEEEETQLVLEIVNEDFADPIIEFQNTREKLIPHMNNPFAIRTISFIDETLNKINKLIE